MPTIAQAEQAPARASLLYDPKLRAIVYQAVLTVVVVFLVYTAATNAVANLRAARIASGFGFLSTTSGFDVNQTFIRYSAATSTYGDAFLVGLLNTLVVAAIGIFFATILGFVVGIARLSKNWVVAKVAMVYVEVIRNLPLLLQLLFWYVAVLTSLPGPRQSLNAGDLFFLNQRGLFVPKPMLEGHAWLIPLTFIAGIIATIAFHIWARRQQEQTGRQYPVGLTALGLILGLPALVWVMLALVGDRPACSCSPSSWRCSSGSSPTRPGSSPRWCGPASWPSRRARRRRQARLGCAPATHCASSSCHRRCG